MNFVFEVDRRAQVFQKVYVAADCFVAHIQFVRQLERCYREAVSYFRGDEQHPHEGRSRVSLRRSPDA